MPGQAWSQGLSSQGKTGHGKEGLHRVGPDWFRAGLGDVALELVERRYCSPAIAVLDANVTTPVELLAILEPAVGGLGVPRCCLALQRLLLTHLSRLALHLLQLGPGSCRVQGREVSVGVVGTEPGTSS